MEERFVSRLPALGLRCTLHDAVPAAHYTGNWPKTAATVFDSLIEAETPLKVYFIAHYRTTICY